MTKLENNTDRSEIQYRPAVKFRKVDKKVLERLQIDENKDDRELSKEMDDEVDEAGEVGEEEKSEGPSMVPLLTPNEAYLPVTAFDIDPNIDINSKRGGSINSIPSKNGGCCQCDTDCQGTVKIKCAAF